MHKISGETESWENLQLHLIVKDGELLQSFQTVKYVNVALLALLVYDHCLTFNLEKTRIWTLRWGLPKILFMINRYLLPPIFFFEGLTNVIHVGQNICYARIFTPIPAFPALMTVELMLMIRVLALYENSKFMARYLIVQFVVQIIGVAIIAVMVLSKTRSISGQQFFTGCLLSLPDWSYLSWTQPLVVEIILVVLSVYKCTKHGAFSQTTKMLARDSIVYFFCISVVLIFNLVYARRHVLLGTALTMPTSVLACIAASRLSMNVRSMTMNRALSLSVQTRPTVLFRGPQSVSYDLREVVYDDIEERPGMSREDGESNPSHLSEPDELLV